MRGVKINNKNLFAKEKCRNNTITVKDEGDIYD